jgi:hypothetical protein
MSCGFLEVSKDKESRKHFNIPQLTLEAQYIGNIFSLLNGTFYVLLDVIFPDSAVFPLPIFANG